jgi:hypothetical protein
MSKTLKKKDLHEGAVVSLEGEDVVLIKRSPSWRDDDIPYLVHEYEREDKPPILINYAKQRWLVEYEDGFRTHRYIEYFYSRGMIYLEDNDKK